MANEKVAIEPQLQDRSLLAADRTTGETRRIETDNDGNVYVTGSLTTVPSGTQDVRIVDSSIDVPVEVQNFPAVQPVSDNGGSLTVDGTVAVSNFPASQPVTGPLTDTQLRASAVPVSVASLPLPSGAATESTLSGVKSDLDKVVGTWSYYAGTSGTVNVTSGQRVIGISAHSTLGGTITINGGATITIPANTSIAIAPIGNVVAPTIIFTGTDTYFIEVVS